MKTILIMLGLFSSLHGITQEKTKPFSPQVGITVNTTAAYRINDNDTTLKNALVLAPFFRIMHKSGLGLNYSFSTLASGTGNKLFMHTASAFYEEYDKPVNLNFRYTHFFFTNNTFIPYSPITNELYGYIAYKKLWLAPAAAVSFGFGKDENNQTQASLNTALGITHNFQFSNNTIDEADIAPSIFINGGNNEFYSFLTTNRYITQSTGRKGFLKSHGHGNGNGGNAPTDTKSVTNNFTLNNVEFNLYSSFTIGHFEIVPDASIFVPMNADNGFGGYWQLKLGYNLANNKLQTSKINTRLQ